MAYNGNKIWTADEDELLQTLIQQGKTYRQIGDVLGRTESAISDRLWWKKKQSKKQTTMNAESEITVTENTSKQEEAILDIAKETACRLGYGCIARIEYRNTETQESATVRATDDSGNAISVVIIKHGKEGVK